MISVDSPDPIKEYKTLIAELKAYDPDLLSKQRVVTLTKTDLMEPKSVIKLQKKMEKALKGQEIMTISSVAHVGLEELNERIWQALQVWAAWKIHRPKKRIRPDNDIIRLLLATQNPQK